MMEKKIEEIILTTGITNITRVVRILKSIGGNLAELSIIMDIPQEVLEKELDPKPGEGKPKMKMPNINFKQYNDVFFEGYQSGSGGMKFKPLAKDFVQMKNMMKLVTLEELKMIMDLYIRVKTDIAAKRKVEFELANFAKNISPGYIVSKVNFLLIKVHGINGPKKETNYEKTKL